MTQQQHHFHLTLREPHDAPQVAEALRQAGIETWEVEEVSPKHGGIIITQELARWMWEHLTGQVRCEGHCRNEPGAPQHMTWEELSTEQQAAFTSDMAHFVEAGRQEELRLERDSLDEDDNFDGVALYDCGPTGR